MDRFVLSYITLSVVLVFLQGCKGSSSGSPDDTILTAAHFDAPNTQNIFSLNDTGWVTCISEAGTSECDLAIHLPQDGMYGRDYQSQSATLNKVGGGFAGFDFLKINENGILLADQQASYNITPWSCVYDFVTGLTWEVKSIENTLRNWDSHYSWYNPDSDQNGSEPGMQNGGVCQFIACDTESYINAVNEANLCGYNDWRLPSRQELNSIVSYSNQPNVFLLDQNYFIFNLSGMTYWTATTYSEEPTQAWVFSGRFGLLSYPISKSTTARIRLVRSDY
jgi:hypothetical protein